MKEAGFYRFFAFAAYHDFGWLGAVVFGGGVGWFFGTVWRRAREKARRLGELWPVIAALPLTVYSQFLAGGGLAFFVIFATITTVVVRISSFSPKAAAGLRGRDRSGRVLVSEHHGFDNVLISVPLLASLAAGTLVTAIVAVALTVGAPSAAAMLGEGERVMDPFVSVIMPVRNEARFIANALSAVLAQDYPSDRIEVVVADGMSDDGTREVIEVVATGHPSGIAVRLVDNPGRIVATGMNIALNACRGDVVVRVDGHCEVAFDYVRQCVRVLAESGRTESAGRRRRPDTVIAKAIAVAMSARFGVGGSTFRTVKGKAFDTDTVPFPAYPRTVVDAAGPYDEELVRNQDDEYNYRLRSLGYRVHLSPVIRSRYFSRSSLFPLFRQYLQYGYWKVRVFQKHPRQMRARHYAPGLFVATVIVLSMAAPFSRVGWLALVALLLAYLAAAVGASVASGDRDVWWLLPVVFPILHVAYGVGFLTGLWVFLDRWSERDRSEATGR